MNEYHDKVKRLVKDAKIRFVTVDTNILRKHGFHFDSGILAQLKQFKKSRFQFLISSIVLGEIERQIIESYETSLSGWQKIFNTLKDFPRAASEVKRFNKVVSAIESKNYAFWKVNKFLLDTGAEGVSANHANIEDVVNLYFSQKAPFKSNSKKHEFPDAIALLGLLSWCEHTGSGMIVISDDNDWKSFSEDHPDKLFLFNDIATALEVINETEPERDENNSRRYKNLLEFITKINTSGIIKEELKRKISNQAVPKAESTYAYFSDIRKIDIKKFSVTNPGRVRDDDAGVVILFDINAECEFSGNFDFYSSELKVHMGSADYSVTRNIEAGVLFSAVGDDLEYEVLFKQEDLIIDFGKVEPKTLARNVFE